MTTLSVVNPKVIRQLELSRFAGEIAERLYWADCAFVGELHAPAFSSLTAVQQQRYRRAAERAVIGLYGYTDGRAVSRAIDQVCAAHDVAYEFSGDAEAEIRSMLREVIREYDVQLNRVYTEEVCR